MAFPFLFEDDFESGDNSVWDSEDDGEGLLDFPHYVELARIPGMGLPYRGAYCARIQAGDANDHTLTAGAVNISADGTFGLRLALYLADDFAFTADDTVNLIELQASATVELAIGLRLTAATDLIEVGIGETAPSQFASSPLQRGRWYEIEADGNIDAGGGNDGDGTLYLDGHSVATISSLDQGAITDALLGLMNPLATTTGTVLLDQFVADDARIGFPENRWSTDMYLTKSGHAFVGPGEIENVTLISGAGTDCTLDLYDTDVAATTGERRAHLANTANNEIVDPAGMPVGPLVNGAYVALAGTNPRALVKIRRAVARGSEGAVRNIALART